MIQTKDVHKQFANYFKNENLKPYLYLISKGLSEGHICLDINTIDFKELEEEGFSKLISTEELRKQELVSEGSDYKPLVLWKNKLYLQRYFAYETQVFEKIQNWIQTEKEWESVRMEELKKEKVRIEELFPSSSTNRVDWQLVAALTAVLNQFTIITGGPGTGKTTTVAKVLSVLYHLNPDLKVALAAPTGKAAARMAESLKNLQHIDSDTKLHFESLEPSTIHRLLGYQKNSIYFKHNAENPIPHDLVIIDESSMIDIALFAKLVNSIRPETKIILLGDKDQLASVEAGSLFGDLCMAQPKLNQFSSNRAEFFNQFISNENQKIPVENTQESGHLLFEHSVELQFSHRFSDDEGIGQLSKAILRNEKDSILKFFNNQDGRVEVDTNYSEEIFHDFIKGFEAYIREKDIKKAFEKLNQLRILCAIREGEEGIYTLNDRVQKFLQSKGLIHLDSPFYEHRPLIVNTNNYELGLFNGDIGIVRKDEEGVLKVWFEGADGELKSILPAFIDSAETVFAMTIHKSQGSEFGKVMVVLPQSADIPLLTKELLYTAVTRAKEKVIIQGSKEGILACAERRVQRGSGIMDRFK